MMRKSKRMELHQLKINSFVDPGITVILRRISEMGTHSCAAAIHMHKDFEMFKCDAASCFFCCPIMQQEEYMI